MNSWKNYAKSVFGAVLFASLLVAAPLSAVTAEETAESGDTAAKVLVEKKCSGCHSIDRAYGAKKNHSEWTQTVEKMVRYSDRMDFLNQQEKKIVIDFLANRKSSQADSEK